MKANIAMIKSTVWWKKLRRIKYEKSNNYNCHDTNTDIFSSYTPHNSTS